MKGIAFIFLISYFLAVSAKIDYRQLKCLICRASMEELEQDLAKINPKRKVDVGQYRIDASGNMIQKTVPLARSELHISDKLDEICKRMDDYVRATYKSNGKLTLINLMSPGGGMNPEISNVDIVQDGDLNKSLKFYCDGIVDEFEEEIIEHFAKGLKHAGNKVCTTKINLCTDNLPEDDEDSSSDFDESKIEL